MTKIIVVAGATGNLGQRICRELIIKGANVRAIVRNTSNPHSVAVLKEMGAEIFEVKQYNSHGLSRACTGAICVVSALTGLRDVIVDAQIQLLDAAVAAGVPKFIPSDFSSDFTDIPTGENRNFDLRKEFQQYLNQSNIRATSVFNGCFADILRYNTPLFNVPQKTIGYYDGKADWQIDFTTMDDTAAFTAAAAIDTDTSRFLRISGFTVSPNDLVRLSEQYKGEKFELVNMGSMEGFSAYNKKLRAGNPEGETQLYPKWQQAQYMYSMFLVHNHSLDNNRYPDLKWSGVENNI